jgi:Ca2+-binding RTX toxin-like protein
VKRAGVLAAILGFLLAAAPASAGDRLFATTNESTPRIVSFDSGTPGTYLTDKPITGLGGEAILGLDSRPRGGALYLITGANKLYTVDPATGAAALVATLGPSGGDPFTTLGPSTAFGFDFNPVTDRLRVIGNFENNLRVSPLTGNVTTDTNISPTSRAAVGVAYSNNIPGATATTEYAYGVSNDEWYTVNANAGTLALVGPTSVVSHDAGRVGVDIAPSGLAYATHSDFNDGNKQKLYTVNVATGFHTVVGAVPGPNLLTGFTGLTASTANLAGVTATTQSVSEAAGQATVTIQRQNPRGSLALFWITDDGSATSGEDYETSGSPLTFADGEVSKTATIPVLDNAGEEPDETFDVTFQLLPPSQDGTLIGPKTTITIKDDDTPAPAPPDRDGDGVPDATDNCPNVANAGQADGNGNGVGTACDLAEVPAPSPTTTSPTTTSPNITPPTVAPEPKPGRCANAQKGTAKDDGLVGTAAGDVLNGLAGADSLFGGAGDDCLTGDAGDDWLSGGDGNDDVKGGAGNDIVYGGNGNDTVDGGKGVNVVKAGAGNDAIKAKNKKRETIDCGAGKDTVTADKSDRLKGCETKKR